jgi:type I restriction enzyme S subunit
MTIAANIGATAIAAYPVACPDSVVGITAKCGVAHVGWLQYALDQIRDELDRTAAQNAQKNINLQVLAPLTLRVPPLDEQERISEMLEVWDRAAGNTRLLLANTRKRREALIEALVSGQNQSGSATWRMTSLEELATVVVSSVNKKHQVGERPVQLCNYTDVYYNESISSRLAFMHATATDAEISKFSLRRGDVLITKDSETPQDIAVAACVEDEIPNLVCGYHLAIVRPDMGRVDPVFLRGYFALHRTRAYFAAQANGATRFGLPVQAINQAPIRLPCVEEQRRIACVLKNVNDEIACLLGDLEALKVEKRALMQQLLTGKRRVRVPAPAVEPEPA